MNEYISTDEQKLIDFLGKFSETVEVEIIDQTENKTIDKKIIKKSFLVKNLLDSHFEVEEDWWDFHITGYTPKYGNLRINVISFGESKLNI